MTETPGKLWPILANVVIPRADGHGSAPFGQIAAPHQRALIDAADDPRYLWLVLLCHRAAAKSTTAMLIALGRLLLSNLPIRVVIVSSDADAGKVLIQVGRMLVALNPTLAREFKVGQWKIVRESSGGEIEVMTSDAMTFYGQLPNTIIADELAHWLPSGEKLWTAIASTLPKRRDLELIVLSNCGWLDSWQFPVFDELRATPWCWYHHMQELAPWIDEQQVEAQRRLLPESDFRRLWVPCEWVPGVAGGLDRGDIESAVTLDGPTEWKLPNFGFVMGLDVGLSRDHSSLAVLAVDYARGRVRLADIFDWRPPPGGGKVSFADIKRTIDEMRTRFCSPALFYDPWQAEALVEGLRAEGLHCEPAMSSSASATERTVALVEGVADRRLDLYDSTPAAELLLHDLKRCSIIDKVTGKKIESPRDEHGHGDRLTAFTLPLPTAMRAATAPRRETGPPTAMVHGVQVPLRDGMSILALDELAERFEDRLEGLGIMPW